MGLLDNVLSTIDAKKRSVKRGLMDMLDNPSQWAGMQANRIQEDRYGGAENAQAMKQYLTKQPYDPKALTAANDALRNAAINESLGAITSNVQKLTEFDKYKSTFDDISRQVEKAKANFSADRSRANLDEYNRLLQKRDDAQSIMEQWRPKEAPVESYQGQHSAPMKDSGAPLNNITKDGYYPEDVYGPNGLRYYGTGDEKLDAAAYSVIRQAQGNPFAQVKMYRAVPSDAPSVINNGDWVTTVRQYAKDHGDSALNGDYRIVSKTVPAKKLFTNGDSWLEFGYDQSGRINPALAGAMAGGGLLGLGGYSLMGDQ